MKTLLKKIDSAMFFLMNKEGMHWCKYCEGWFKIEEFGDNLHGHENPDDD